MDQNQMGPGDLPCLTTGTGVVVPLVTAPSGSIGQTLGVNTYYFPFGSQNAPMPSQTALFGIHLKWAATVAATITFEICNFPRYLGGGREGGIDVDDFVTTDWQQWNPASGSPIVQVTGTGNTVTAVTLTAGGTNTGTAYVNLPDMACRRIRMKVITTAGGLFRANARGKFGE